MIYSLNSPSHCGPLENLEALNMFLFIQKPALSLLCLVTGTHTGHIESRKDLEIIADNCRALCVQGRLGPYRTF